MKKIPSLFFLLLFWGLAEPAAARLPEAAQERARTAKLHFDRGLTHFNLGEYEEAIRELQAGYRLKPLPLFLYNIAQAARFAKQPARALEFYRRFLEADPRAPERREVEKWIAQLEAMPAPVEPPKALVVAPPLPITAPVVTLPPMALTDSRLELMKAPPKRSLWRRSWWIVPVGVVAAAGVAVGLGVGITQSRSGCASSSVACVDLAQR